MWARIYSDFLPVIIAYDNFPDGDIGFKLLDNGDYTDIDDRLNQLPYIFNRSEIENEMRTKLPHTLLLRNKNRVVDYMIKFRSTDNLGIFLEFFPDKIHDEVRTRGFYFVPSADVSASESE